MLFKSLVISSFVLLLFSACNQKDTIVIGSKRFTENYLLAEIFALYLEEKGYKVERRFGMGGTMIAYSALQTGEIDLYPEYTGTVSEAVLKIKESDRETLNQNLKPQGVEMLQPLGFDNSYSLIMRKTQADRLGIKKISDLKNYPELKGGMSFEFQERQDGWADLKKVYELNQKVKGIEVPLTYEALKNNKIDFAEAYSTEPLILKYQFVVLKDDKNFFPIYEAVPLVAINLDEKIKQDLNQLSFKISQDEMIEMNSKVVNGMSLSRVSQDFLFNKGLIKSIKTKTQSNEIAWNKLLYRTYIHLLLTGIAVILASVFAIPFAALFSTQPRATGIIMNITGILQTIPSIALLTMMIPFFGIGFKPALVGLFIYSLLPILRNTQSALANIDPRLITSARGIGLYPSEIFFSVKLPLAFPAIIAGIRTATTLNIGTATLAAFIGAGGLGEPIVTGLALNDTSLVLQGAVPAALLALLMDGFFALIEKYFLKSL